LQIVLAKAHDSQLW